MNNEDFVSYETAKRLYVLDCDLNCEMAYFDRPWNHEHQLVSVIDACNQQCAYDGTDVYPAPTLAQAQKWLRETKGIIVLVHLESVNEEMYVCRVTQFHKLSKRLDNGGEYFLDYNSALSAGIKAALELITDKTEKK